MGKITSFIQKYAEKRSVGNPEHWIVKLTEKLGSQAGVLVTPVTALQTSAVFACVRVIAETIGSLPLKIYFRRTDSGKDEANTHPLYSILHDSPNYWQTRQEYFETVSGHLCLRGNSYSFIQRDQANRITALIPLSPDRMELEVDGDSQQPIFIYRYRPNDGEQEQIFQAEDIWHLRGLSSDGYVGLSPIAAAANAIGLAAAAEKHGSQWFKNGAKTSGIAKYPGKLREDSAKRLRTSLQDSMTGDNNFKIILLEEGLDYTAIGINNVDSQYLETRQFQIEEIARIFRVPSVLIGHPDKTMTYASVEQLMLSFVMYTMRPWVSRIEQSINKQLLGTDNKKYFSEFTLDALLRGDTQSRYTAYASALQNKWLTRNEVRIKENLNPVDGGNDFENPAITTETPSEEETPKVEEKAKDVNINLRQSDVNIEPAQVNVTMPAPIVQIGIRGSKINKKAIRDADGQIISIEEVDENGIKTVKRIVRDDNGEIESVIEEVEGE
jgi:HK97 family phage portal protein